MTGVMRWVVVVSVLLAGCGAVPADPRDVVSVPDGWRLIGGHVGSVGSLPGVSEQARLRYDIGGASDDDVVAVLSGAGPVGEVAAGAVGGVGRAWCRSDGDVRVLIGVTGPVDRAGGRHALLVTAAGDCAAGRVPSGP